MSNERLLNAQQTALLVGVSVSTLNCWYKWKKLNPNHELANYLPSYKQIGARQTRYWNADDVWILIRFRQSIPRGRHGILGAVTQKYVKAKRENI